MVENIELGNHPLRASGGGEVAIERCEQSSPKETHSYEDSFFWLVVSTPLKNISQDGNLPQIGMKIENI